MTSVSSDRRQGLNSNAAIKVPCLAATTANITLSGLQTIDGVVLAAGDRVLVKNQTTQSENGIYTADTGAWTRDYDFDGAYDVRRGTMFMILDGATNGATFWYVATSGTITIGTTNITFTKALFSSSSLLSFLQAGAGAVARTAQEKEREILSVADYGAVGDGTDQTVGIEAAAVYARAQGAALYFPPGTWGIDYSASAPTFGLYFGSKAYVYGAGRDLSTIKNLSATAAGVVLGAAYCGIRDITIDNNGSTDSALKLTASYVEAINVALKNQGGTSYALYVFNANSCKIDDVLILTSTYGAMIGDLAAATQGDYFHIRQLAIEATKVCIDIDFCAGLRIFGLYLDCPGGSAMTRWATIKNCSGMEIFDLKMELADTTLAASSYVEMQGNTGLSINGIRINHTGNASKNLFHTATAANKSTVLENLWIATTKASMALLSQDIADVNTTVRNVYTNNANAMTGVTSSVSVAGLRVENWADANASSPMSVDGTDVLMVNLPANAIAITSRARQTLINCGGAVTGTGALTCNIVGDTTQSTGAYRTQGTAAILTATAIPVGGTAGSGYMLSATSNFGIFFGSNAPTLSAAKGSLYLRSNGSGVGDRAYINTDGGTTWTAITTAA